MQLLGKNSLVLTFYNNIHQSSITQETFKDVTGVHGGLFTRMIVTIWEVDKDE